MNPKRYTVCCEVVNANKHLIGSEIKFNDKEYIIKDVVIFPASQAGIFKDEYIKNKGAIDSIRYQNVKDITVRFIGESKDDNVLEIL